MGETKIFGIEFNPKAAYEFITFGIKHLTIWTFDAKSNKMNGTRGLFGNGKADTIICATYLPNGNFATGTHSGDILYWSGNQVVKVIPKIHDVSIKVFCFFVFPALSSQ